MSKHPNFAKIPTSAVRALANDDVGNIEVYLPSSDGKGPVFYSDSAHGGKGPDLSRLLDSGVSTILVRSDELFEFEKSIESRIDNILKNPNIPAVDKAEIVHNAGTSAAKNLLQSSVSADSLARANSLVESVLSSVTSDSKIAGHIFQMVGHERSTASHMQMVSTLAILFGYELFGSDEKLLRALGLAGMLHDIGKLSIPADILNRPGPLSQEEVLLLQQHPVEGVRLIGDDESIPQITRQFILQHHERIDGRGYPLGLSGDEILPGSRALSIVDSFHAMIGPRAYRSQLGIVEANRVMSYQANRQFDADMLKCWTSLCEKKEAAVRNSGRAAGGQEEASEDLSDRHENALKRAGRLSVNQRRPRHRFRGTSVVRCLHAGSLNNSKSGIGEFGACVFDLSRGGMCILSAHPLYRGEILNIRVRVGRDFEWLKTMVSWSRRFQENVFKVGLRFLGRINADSIYERADVVPMGGYIPVKSADDDETSFAPPFVEAERESRSDTESALEQLDTIAQKRDHSSASQQVVIALSMSSDKPVRIKAIDVMSTMGARATRSALVDLLHDADAEVRERAILAVGSGKVYEAASALRELLNDPEEKIALNAAGALGQMNDWSGFNFVAKAVEGNGKHARLAVRAFSDITQHRFSSNREGIASAKRYLKAKRKELESKARGVAVSA
ncbi:MAG: HEAT repeat domain-containing protein [Phycisphaerae bacterium]